MDLFIGVTWKFLGSTPWVRTQDLQRNRLAVYNWTTQLYCLPTCRENTKKKSIFRYVWLSQSTLVGENKVVCHNKVVLEGLSLCDS